MAVQSTERNAMRWSLRAGHYFHIIIVLSFLACSSVFLCYLTCFWFLAYTRLVYWLCRQNMGSLYDGRYEGEKKKEVNYITLEDVFSLFHSLPLCAPHVVSLLMLTQLPSRGYEMRVQSCFFVQFASFLYSHD